MLCFKDTDAAALRIWRALAETLFGIAGTHDRQRALALHVHYLKSVFRELLPAWLARKSIDVDVRLVEEPPIPELVGAAPPRGIAVHSGRTPNTTPVLGRRCSFAAGR